MKDLKKLVVELLLSMVTLGLDFQMKGPEVPLGGQYKPKYQKQLLVVVLLLKSLMETLVLSAILLTKIPLVFM